MRSAIALLAAVALVGGCSSSEPSNNTTGSTPPATSDKANAANHGGSSSAPKPTTSPDSSGTALIYPGARVLSKNVRDTTVTADIETKDPVDKVVAFYEKELSAKASGTPTLKTLEGKKGEYSYGIYIAPKQGGLTAVSILGEKK